MFHRCQASLQARRRSSSRGLECSKLCVTRNTRGPLPARVRKSKSCIVRIRLVATQLHATASERAGGGREAAGRLVRSRAVEGELRGAAGLVRHPPVALLLHAEAAAHAQLVHLCTHRPVGGQRGAWRRVGTTLGARALPLEPTDHTLAAEGVATRQHHLLEVVVAQAAREIAGRGNEEDARRGARSALAHGRHREG